jgi:hypothetical protein
MEDALAGPDRASRDAEYSSQLENGTWELTHLPPGKQAYDSKWVVRIKTDEAGKVDVYKSRLVVKGFQQKEGVDYNEVFAPTAKAPTLRVLLAGAAVCGWHIQQMDVKTAFLYGDIKEEIYMKQPSGYDDGSGRVCRLKKAIYGLKQAPRCWYEKLSGALEEIGFHASSCDESLFILQEKGKQVLLLVYVDDLLLFSSDLLLINKVEGELKTRFKCKSMGAAHYYLGMHIERDPCHSWVKLHQEKYIGSLVERYVVDKKRRVATPLPADFKLVKAAEGGVDRAEQQQFQSLVGALLYAGVHTRPDTSFAVGQLARVVQNPSEEQLYAAERVVQYLGSTRTIGVQYSPSAQRSQKGVELLWKQGEQLGERKLFLTCFTDATWASEEEDSSSVGGYWCVVGGGPVSWKSKKQNETALSSAESEYIAMFHGVKEVI